MANPERGEVPWVVGNVVYTLRITTGACCELEAFANRTSDDVIRGINAGRISDLRLMLWLALRAAHPEVASFAPGSLEVIGNVIDAGGGPRNALQRVRVLTALNTDTGQRGGESRPQDPRRRKPLPWRRVLIQALGIGLDDATFWALSLRELWNHLEAAKERDRDAKNRDVAVAWHTEAFRRQERLPSLKSLLIKSQSGPQAGVDASTLYQLSALYGLKLTVTKKASGAGA